MAATHLIFILILRKMINRFSFNPSFVLYLAGFTSALLHTGLVLVPLPNFFLGSEQESEEAIEVVIEAPEKPVAVITAEPKVQPKPLLEKTSVSEVIPEIAALPEQPQKVTPSPPPQLNPQITPQNLAQDAPASDQITPAPSPTGDLAMPSAIGKVIQENARGWGFGLDRQPSGFDSGDPNGDPTGDPKGSVDGVKTNSPIPSNSPSKLGAIEPPPPAKPKLECISCPKPQFRGKEGTPRVTYDITPDGRVTNVRLRQSSGDPETDRATLEAMGKWQFNPKTVPEGGRANVRVRVTFEESGSQFQRQNDERRREQERQRLAEQEAERQRIAEQERLTRSQPVPPTPEPAFVPPPPPVSENLP